MPFSLRKSLEAGISNCLMLFNRDEGLRLKLETIKHYLGGSEENKIVGLHMLKKLIDGRQESILERDEDLTQEVNAIAEEKSPRGRLARIIVDIDGQFKEHGELLKALIATTHCKVMAFREGHGSLPHTLPISFKGLSVEQQRRELLLIINSERSMNMKVVGFSINLLRKSGCYRFRTYCKKPRRERSPHGVAFPEFLSGFRD